MRAIIYFRVRAENLQMVTELIEFYSNVIQRKNNDHHTSHTILNIFQYRGNDDPEFYFPNKHLIDQQQKWIQEVNTKQKYIEFIKDFRLMQIMNPFYRLLDTEHKPILDNLSQAYKNVNNRETENEFLHKTESILMPITLEKWMNKKKNRSFI